MKLAGARALITGGSEGIGQGIAAALLAKGAQVAIMARNEDKLRSRRPRSAPWPSRRREPEEDAERAVADGGEGVRRHRHPGQQRGHRLLRAAGRAGHESSSSASSPSTSPAPCSWAGRRPATSWRRTAGSSSTSRPPAGWRGQDATAYSGCKFALRGMTECWRAELRPHNVRVTLVNPSEVQTPFFAKVGASRSCREKKLRPRRSPTPSSARWRSTTGGSSPSSRCLPRIRSRGLFSCFPACGWRLYFAIFSP